MISSLNELKSIAKELDVEEYEKIEKKRLDIQDS